MNSKQKIVLAVSGILIVLFLLFGQDSSVYGGSDGWRPFLWGTSAHIFVFLPKKLIIALILIFTPLLFLYYETRPWAKVLTSYRSLRPPDLASWVESYRTFKFPKDAVVKFLIGCSSLLVLVVFALAVDLAAADRLLKKSQRQQEALEAAQFKAEMVGSDGPIFFSVLQWGRSEESGPYIHEGRAVYLFKDKRLIDMENGSSLIASESDLMEMSALHGSYVVKIFGRSGGWAVATLRMIEFLPEYCPECRCPGWTLNLSKDQGEWEVIEAIRPERSCLLPSEMQYEAY